MQQKHYYICKQNENKEIVCLNYDKFKGYDFTPKNKIEYEGIKVNKMIIIKPSLIEKTLRRKIKRKLDLYLQLIIRFMESDEGESHGSINECLSDLTKYRNIVLYKYKKYLDDKYLKILLKKIELLEFELNKRIEECYEIEEEKTSRRSR